MISRSLARVVLMALVLEAVVVGHPALAEERLVLAGVASTTGAAEARFVSTVWLANPSDASLTVQLGVVTFSGEASAPAFVTLASRETRRIDDPLVSLFGLAQTAGTLKARSDRPFVLRGVTANVTDPAGTFGLALVALRESEALRPGETGLAPWLTHTAATGTGFRTNIAVTLLEAGSAARVTIVDDSGLIRGEELVSGDAVFWQRSVSDLSADPEIPLGRAEVTVLRGSAVAYTAVVDNVTGDGIVAMARRDEARERFG